jgi:hypothetical protein
MTADVVIVVVGGISATYWKRANDADRVVLESVIPEERTPVRAQPEASLGTPVAVKSTELVDLSNGVESSSVEQDSVANQISAVTSEPTQLGIDADAESVEQDSVANQISAVTSERTQLGIEADAESSETAEVVVRPLTVADMDTRIIGSLSGLAADDATVSTTPPEEAKTAPRNQLEIDTTQDSGDTGPRDIVLFFDQGSWADIRDSRSRQLLRESVRAGTTVRLEGDPPFTVFVGNARGVRYVYRGEEKTAPAFGEGLFGRFQVGVSE